MNIKWPDRIKQSFHDRKMINKAMKIYGGFYKGHYEVLSSLIESLNKQACMIAVWGAGLKGAAFLKVFDDDGSKIKYVYDINQKRHGTYMPTGHSIADYCEEKNQDIGAVFVMNNNYETEIAGMLLQQHLQVKLINIDSIIYGDLGLQEALEMYGGILGDKG